MKIAEILCIGSEITRGRITNTNSAFLSARLTQEGFDVKYHTACPDEEGVMTKCFKLAAQRADLVVITGGLGPTEDDMTTGVITKVLRTEVMLARPAVERVLEILRTTKKIVTRGHLRMAEIPKKTTLLPNAVGMAAGYYFRYNKGLFVVLPGVPREMKSMFEHEATPKIRQHFFKSGEKEVSQSSYASLTFKILGVAESQVSRKVKALDIPKRFPAVAVAYQVPFPYVHVVLETWEGQVVLNEVGEEVRRTLGEDVVAEGTDTLAGAVIAQAVRLERSIALAESCTGGLVAGALTEIPGSSSVFLGGIVCYSNASKVRELGVGEEVLRMQGAVSADCALAMAQGVKRRFGADVALAVTGIAGPSGGSPEKPVGTVWMALVTETDAHTQVFSFKGDRTMIRQAATAWALRLLRSGVGEISNKTVDKTK